jgi:hypothetical protein
VIFGRITQVLVSNLLELFSHVAISIITIATSSFDKDLDFFNDLIDGLLANLSISVGSFSVSN